MMQSFAQAAGRRGRGIRRQCNGDNVSRQYDQQQQFGGEAIHFPA
jgi:hypothetical protein